MQICIPLKKNNHPSPTRWALAKPSSPRFNTVRILDNDRYQKSLIEGGEPLKALNQTSFTSVQKKKKVFFRLLLYRFTLLAINNLAMYYLTKTLFPALREKNKSEREKKFKKTKTEWKK